MQNYTDIMIDLETFGNGNDATIVSIGAVAFNSKAGRTANSLFDDLAEGTEGLLASGQAFEVKVRPGDSAHPGEMTPETVEWWLGQSDEARQALLEGPRESLGSALDMFVSWAQTVDNLGTVRLWSRGPTFDETILRSAFRRYKMTDRFPTNFWNARCCRTIEDLARDAGWSSIFENQLAHSAVNDAIHQARTVTMQVAHLSSRVRS